MKRILFSLIALTVTALAQTEPEDLPMYGDEHKPCLEENKGFSKDAAKLGWKYFYGGDPDVAMKRFNQAWMFDRKNPEAYWGFGLIMGQRAAQAEPEKNLQESIRFLDMARKLDEKNGRIVGDLAFSHTLLGNVLTSEGKDGKAQFATAEKLFAQAYALDAKYPPISMNWSVLKFYSGDYPEAKRLLAQAVSLGMKPDSAYVKELEGRVK